MNLSENEFIVPDMTMKEMNINVIIPIENVSGETPSLYRGKPLV